MEFQNQAAAAGEGFDYEGALAACAGGDSSALRRLYDREASHLLGIAMRILRRRDLASDVVHDAFLQIWQRADTFDPARGSGRTWIISVVRYQCFKVRRRITREAPFDHVREAAIPDEGPDPLSLLAGLQEAQALHRCLQQLDAPKRDAILLAYVEGLSHAEIAARRDAPLGTVKAWVRRGLLSLRDCLG